MKAHELCRNFVASAILLSHPDAHTRHGGCVEHAHHILHVGLTCLTDIPILERCLHIAVNLKYGFTEITKPRITPFAFKSHLRTPSPAPFRSWSSPRPQFPQRLKLPTLRQTHRRGQSSLAITKFGKRPGTSRSRVSLAYTVKTVAHVTTAAKERDAVSVTGQGDDHCMMTISQASTGSNKVEPSPSPHPGNEDEPEDTVRKSELSFTNVLGNAIVGNPNTHHMLWCANF